MARFLFVGEQPSETAYLRGWTWRDGKLAAKTLFDALASCGIAPSKCGFVNALCDHPGQPDQNDTAARIKCLRAAAESGAKLVALGNKVSTLLAGNGIRHLTLRHPAARGAGRAKGVYAEHVRTVLKGAA